MNIRDRMPGWKKSLILGLVSISVISGVFITEINKKSSKNEYKFQDKWVCYQGKDSYIEIMHLNITPFFISENNNKIEYYEIKDNIKNYSEYEVYYENKKYADIVEIKKNRIEYKKIGGGAYVCKRSSKFNHVNDFTGKWIGYINSSKNSKLNEVDKEEQKIILTLYNDKIFFTGENLPKEFSYRKVLYLTQQDGEFKIKFDGPNDINSSINFKILSNKELILKVSPINNIETYFKRIDKF